MDFARETMGHTACPRCAWPYVFRGQGVDNAFVSFPNYWKHLFEDTPLCGAVPLGGSTHALPTCRRLYSIHVAASVLGA